MAGFFASTDPTLLTVSLSVFIGIFTLIGIYKGARRGFSRQLIRFISVIVSLLLSIYLVRLGTAASMAWLEGQTAESISAAVDGLGIPFSESFAGQLFSHLETSTMSHTVAIPLALVIAPIAFSVCFFISSLLILIVHAIVSGLFGFFKRRNNAITRFFGLLLGGAQGVLVSLLLLVPISGLCANARTAIEDYKTESGVEEAPATVFYEDFIEVYAENPIIKMSGALGGRFIYNTVSTLTVDGVKYKMTETVATPIIEAYNSYCKTGEFDWKATTQENETGIRQIINILNESEYGKILVSGVLDSFAKAYADGVIVFELPSPLDEVVASAVSVFDGIDKDTLLPTLNTVADAYFLLSSEGVFAAMEQNPDTVTDVLTRNDAEGNTVVTKVITLLKSNERTKPVVITLTKISVSAMAEKLGTGEDTAELYENVKSGFNETLKINKSDYATDEEYTSAISDSLDQTLKANGIEIEVEIVDEMADYVAENFSEVENVTDEELNDIILSYYDAYIKYNATGEIPEEN